MNGILSNHFRPKERNSRRIEAITDIIIANVVASIHHQLTRYKSIDLICLI